ncbi:MAG TPA: MFS transporter [Anaerolineales bacterium]|nr:MFS transporter [Anaerolineales bacterium]
MGSESTGSVRRVIKEYALNVKAFKPNARLYLVNVVIIGVAMGVFRLLFNFYVLSLGFDEALLGNLITTNNLTALIVALPVGYLADLLGRKRALIIAGVLVSLSIIVMIFWQQEQGFYAMNILSGFAQSLASVTMAPFLMENSQEKERTYLFSFSSGLQMAMASVGNWIGGYLPSWVSMAQSTSATSSTAYAGSLLIIGLVAGLGVIPLAFMRIAHLEKSERSIFAPLSYAARHPGLLGKLILPMLITSIGAGLIMPFMNVFFRVVHHQPDPVIGVLFAWGSLAMGIGLLIAPPIAERMGKIQFVVVTQGLSIPFLVLLGFSPLFWLSAAAYYVRLALMNMSAPVYQTFVMEQVDSSARATVASLVSMSWNFGWAFSPTVSGWLQVRYGFTPPFLGTLTLYTISTGLYWAFFWRKQRSATPLPIPEG